MTRLFLLVMLLLPVNLFADRDPTLGRATVSGAVRDDTGAPIPGVTVSAKREEGDESIAVTDGEGAFRMGDLPPGSYQIDAALDGFQSVSRKVTLVTGQKLELAFKLVAAFAETVTVIADRAKTGEVAILENRRQAAVVSDSISAEEIRKTPDSNAASVVERLTGVTLLGNKYVFVRGLGERYSGTTINGATLPTTETEKRVVPLDLFPAKLLDTVNVVKTYTPDKPGDFGSGVVEMTTTQFPSAASFKLSLGTSHHSGATGSTFRRYSGGLNRLGEGGQAMPSSIPSELIRRRSILDPTGYSPEELAVFGRALAGNWTGARVGSASPASDFSLTFGNSYGRLGVVVSAVSNHGYAKVEEEQRFFGIDNGVLVPINDYDLIVDRETASTGFVGNLSYRLADDHRVFVNWVNTRDASAEDRLQEGLNTSAGGNIRDYRVRYQLEEMTSTRLRGEHNLAGPGIGSLVEWTVGRSNAENNADLRENVYQEDTPGVFRIVTGYADTGKIEYHALDDRIDQSGLTYTLFLAPANATWSGSLKGGVEKQERTRDFQARRFRFFPGSAVQFDATLLPDQIFTLANIGPNLFEIREQTGVNDAYDAEHATDAAFLMSDLTFGKWRVIGGARYESSDQSVVTFNPFDVRNPVDAINETNDLLPSLNVVYQIDPQTNLRVAYGRSVNRPEFRELSPFTFTEVAGGRSVAGNPNLEQATLDSFDVRWETFPGTSQVIAASAFYKMIDKPIERVVQPTTDWRQSFVNAESANLWGFEVEFRHALDAFFTPLRFWSVNLNYSYIQSDVTVGEHQFSVVTNTDRPLEGQSDQVANIALQFHHPRLGTMFRMLGSYSGERLTEVGAFGLPDTYEAANTSFDVVVSQDLSRGMELKLAGTNLFNERREFIQAGQVQRSLEPGRKVSLSLSYSPF